MKLLFFSTMTLVGLLLMGVQHHQLGALRAENSALTQASAEASRLRQELATTTGNAVQDDAELERLRQENGDLLKLRNEINQLREARVEFDKVNAENQRLQTLVRTAEKSVEKDSAMQPIVVPIAQLSNRGFATPDDTLFTFFWAQRNNDLVTVTRCMAPIRTVAWHENFKANPERFNYLTSIEIAAWHHVNFNTIQLGVRIHSKEGSQSDQLSIIQLFLIGTEWKLDADGLY